jgi:hypothetical protein
MEGAGIMHLLFAPNTANVRERTGVPRTATAGAKKETMSLSGKRKHRTFDSLPSKLKNIFSAL